MDICNEANSHSHLISHLHLQSQGEERFTVTTFSSLLAMPTFVLTGRCFANAVGSGSMISVVIGTLPKPGINLGRAKAFEVLASAMKTTRHKRRHDCIEVL